MAAYLDTDTLAELALQRADDIGSFVPGKPDYDDEWLDAMVSDFIAECEARADEAWRFNPVSWEPLD